MNEQEKIFDAARELFNTEGWANFVNDIQNNIAAIRVENIDDEKGFWIAKGQLNVLHSITGYENMMRAAEESADEDEEYAENI
jgi:hypothetical protein